MITPVMISPAAAMSLASSLISGELYGDVKLLIQGVNKHADSEVYAVVIARFKKFKKDIDRLVYLRCDRERKTSLNSVGFERRLHSDTRLIKCSFSVVVKRNQKGRWYLEIIRNEDHNHTATLAVAHSALRKLVMIAEIRKSITSLIKVKVKSSQILTYLRLNANEDNSLFIRHNIYNAKTYLKRKTLDVLSFIQALLQNLKRKDWFWQYEKNEFDRIIKLFFSQLSCSDLLKLNSEILFINCTYKTNRYKILLLIIIEVTLLNIIFYVEFCFMSAEKTANYI